MGSESENRKTEKQKREGEQRPWPEEIDFSYFFQLFSSSTFYSSCLSTKWGKEERGKGSKWLQKIALCNEKKLCTLN